jgi:hypothetical protein
MVGAALVLGAACAGGPPADVRPGMAGEESEPGQEVSLLVARHEALSTEIEVELETLGADDPRRLEGEESLEAARELYLEGKFEASVEVLAAALAFLRDGEGGP